MLEERALAEVERLRNELGASDMALEATRSLLERHRFESALDRRATVSETNAAAARAAVASEPFSQPVPGSMTVGRPTQGDDAGAAPLAAASARAMHAATELVVVRQRSMVDFFA